MNNDTAVLLGQLEKMPDKISQIRVTVDDRTRAGMVRFMIKSGILTESFDLNNIEWDQI